MKIENVKLSTLRDLLIIYEGELKADAENENGSFDEKIETALKDCLSCDELVDGSSNDILVQLDSSVYDDFLGVFIDGFFYGHDGIIRFTATDKNEEVCDYRLDEIGRYSLIKVIHRLIKMCGYQLK